MNKKKILGFVLIALGLTIFSLKPIISITGFAVVEQISEIGNLWFYIIGSLMIVGGLVLQTNSDLETRVGVGAPEAPPIELSSKGYKIHHEDTPIILDTNFLIDSTKDTQQYKKLKKDIRTLHDIGYPIIVPDNVLSEFRADISGLPKVENQRRKNIRDLIKKYAVTMQEYDPEWINSREELIGESMEIIKEVPKSLAFEYIQHKTNNPNDTPKKYFKGQLNAEILEMCDKLERKLATARNLSERRKVLRKFSPSKADATVLASALFLNKKGRVYGSDERYSSLVISNDDHIKQAVEEIRRDRSYKHREDLYSFSKMGSFQS